MAATSGKYAVSRPGGDAKLQHAVAVRDRALAMIDEGYSDDDVDKYIASEGLTPKDLRETRQRQNRLNKGSREDMPSALATGIVTYADQGIPFYDEMLAGGVAAGKKLTGDKRKLGDIYKGEKEFVNRSIERFEQANPGAATAGRIGGALHQGLITGRYAVPKGASPTRALAGLGLEGAGTAAVEAADQAEGGLLERGKAAVKAAPIGAALGLTFGGASMAAPALVKTILRGGKKGRQRMQDALKDFEAAGIEPTLGQAAKGGVGQSLEGGMRNVPFIQKPLQNRYKEQDVEMRNVLTRARESMGPGADITDAAGAGQRISEGVDSWVKRMRGQQKRMYDDIGNRVGWGSRTSVVNTTQALMRLQERIPDVPAISNLFSNPKIGAMFDAVVSQSQRGPFTFRAVKQMRTEIGRMLEEPTLLTDVPRGELKELYKALSQDLDITVANAAMRRGRGIYRSWKRANSFTQKLHDRVESTLQPMLNRSTPEDIYKYATRNGTTLRTVLKSVRLPEERRAMVGTMLHRMAQAPPGYQDATGEMFSAQSFLTNWNKLDADSKSVVLSQLPRQTRDQFKAVLKVAAHRKEGASAMANPSGTSPNISFQAVFAGLLWSIMGITKLVAGAAGGMAASKAMTNPRMVKALARPTRANTLTRAAAIGLPGMAGYVGSSAPVQGMFGD